MKRALLFIAFLQFYLASHSQKIFFQSSQSITKGQLASFHASVNAANDLVLFNAPDYLLYAYDKSSGKEKWRYPLGRRSDNPPFFAGGFIWATSGDESVVKLDPITGKCLKTLAVSTVETQPFVKNGILYFTGIYDGGSLIAYDMNTDSVIWQRFLAHGCSRTPYYLANKIIANAEGDSWIEVNYDGTLTEPGCDTPGHIFPSELPCAKQFDAITHDGIQLKGTLAAAVSLYENTDPGIVTTPQCTFILNEGQLFVLGNKGKMKYSIQLASLSATIEEAPDNSSTILKADEENIFILYGNRFIAYDHRNKKLVKIIDLEQWMPHQALLDGDRLWLVSKKDGLLYGHTTD